MNPPPAPRRAAVVRYATPDIEILQPGDHVLCAVSGKMISLMEKVAPRTLDRYLERSGFTGQKKDEPVHTADSLYAPGTDGRRRGQTAHTTLERSTYTRAAMSDMARLLPVIAFGALLTGAVRSLRHSG